MDTQFTQMFEEGKKCVEEYADTALAAGFIPFVSTPIVHGICIKMLAKLDEIFDIKGGFGAEKFANVVVGGLATPLMFIPIAGSVFGKAYVESVGERYLDAVQERHEKLAKRNKNVR